MHVTKNEKQENAGNLIPVFGVTYDVTQPNELQTAIEAAERYKTEAKQYFEQSRRYLAKCSSLLNNLKAKQYYAGKEVCHE